MDVMLDLISYIFGYKKGRKDGASDVVIAGDTYTYTDPNNDGNIVITEVTD